MLFSEINWINFIFNMNFLSKRYHSLNLFKKLSSSWYYSSAFRRNFWSMPETQDNKKISNEFFTFIRRKEYSLLTDTHYKAVVSMLESKDRSSISKVVTLIESSNSVHRLKADELFKRLFKSYNRLQNNNIRFSLSFV